LLCSLHVSFPTVHDSYRHVPALRLMASLFDDITDDTPAIGDGDDDDEIGLSSWNDRWRRVPNDVWGMIINHLLLKERMILERTCHYIGLVSKKGYWNTLIIPPLSITTATLSETTFSLYSEQETPLAMRWRLIHQSIGTRITIGTTSRLHTLIGVGVKNTAELVALIDDLPLLSSLNIQISVQANSAKTIVSLSSFAHLTRLVSLTITLIDSFRANSSQLELPSLPLLQYLRVTSNRSYGLLVNDLPLLRHLEARGITLVGSWAVKWSAPLLSTLIVEKEMSHYHWRSLLESTSSSLTHLNASTRWVQEDVKQLALSCHHLNTLILAGVYEFTNESLECIGSSLSWQSSLRHLELSFRFDPLIYNWLALSTLTHLQHIIIRASFDGDSHRTHLEAPLVPLISTLLRVRNESRSSGDTTDTVISLKTVNKMDAHTWLTNQLNKPSSTSI
jgi:hypothetical protein